MATAPNTLIKGYACNNCGLCHRFPAYVYAHWWFALTHTCEGCGARHRVFLGMALKIGRVKKGQERMQMKLGAEAFED